jgi:hypothetical protein
MAGSAFFKGFLAKTDGVGGKAKGGDKGQDKAGR